jgi:toxin-antitoxin system PIN domain toxin
VILVDANLLVYAANPAAAEHERARAWLDAKLGGEARVGLPWESLLAFVRLFTNRRVFARPASLAAAWRTVEGWLSSELAFVPVATARHAEILGGLLATRGLGSNDVPDAHLAALAIEHGLTLCSADAGFARFAGLRWENPLRSV